MEANSLISLPTAISRVKMKTGIIYLKFDVTAAQNAFERTEDSIHTVAS
jgi:hypothetical protein